MKKNLVLFSLVTIGSALVFNYVRKCSKRMQQHFETLPEEKKYEYEVRDYALRNNPFYQSGDVFLERAAIAHYDQHPELQTKARFWLEHEKRMERERLKSAPTKDSPSNKDNFNK